MSSPRRMAALAIGVRDAPPLDYLSGAVNGARAFHEWAQALGYDSRLVTDEDEPVTVARLRSELEGLLPSDGPPTYRLLIYFAGHGVIHELEQGLWLPSDWYHELRAIAVEPLKRRLADYRVGQVAVFADACRSLPSDVDTADLTQDKVLARGPGPRNDRMAVDKFIATQDGTRTLMIPGSSPEEDRCLFSGVLLEGLWGTKKSAFSPVVPGKVTSQSLGTYLQTEVAQLAASYESKVVPDVNYTFPANDDIYFGDGPQVTPPVFPPWPPAEDLIALDGAVRSADMEVGRDVSPQRADSLEEQLRNQQLPPNPLELWSGFAVDGGPVVAIWTAPYVVAEAHDRPDWLRVGKADGGLLVQPAPILFELASGLFAAVTALPDFVASVVVTDRGVAALVYRDIYAQPTAATATEDAIVQLERGGLRADDATDLAAELRQRKHADPVRGVISAYLYDSVGDVESIRRMAFFYIQHEQAIPYDIALLAQLEGEKRDDGLLWATVPEVLAREPRTEKETGLSWTCSATPRATGVVGGFWPWLRQGWAFLDDPAEDGSTLVLPGVLEAAGDLTPARFTTLHHAGAQRLADAFGLRDPEGGKP